MDCELCLLKRKTNVYIDNEYFIIMDCDSCHVPMIVWKEHTMDVPDPDEQIMEAFLTEVANRFYGGKNYFIELKLIIENLIVDIENEGERLGGESMQ